MSMSRRYLARLTFCGLTLAFAALPVSTVWAQTPPETPVETYINQAVPESSALGVMPEGMTWNRPLKAGDMVLPRPIKPKKAEEATQTISSLKAPRLGVVVKQTAAPKLSVEKESTQSLMLIQGMKSALKQAGQNPDIPKSGFVESPTNEKTFVQSNPTPLEALAQTATSTPAGDDAAKYVEGQEPRKWVVPDSSNAEVKASSDGMMDITFPPEMASSSGEPKATELTEPPTALETAPSKKKEEEKGFWDKVTKPFTSIFGEPVEESGAEQRQAASVSTIDDIGCQSTVTKWTRECGDAGYPAHFVGQIAGETRVECPSGEVKDVWLSNTCAAPVGNSSYSVQDTKATKLTEESIADASGKVTETRENIIVPDADSSVDGACGLSNGLAAGAKPAGDLCSQGEATTVLGDGPWRWSCKGHRGGITVSCAAPVVSGSEVRKGAGVSTPDSQEPLTQDGKCGIAAETATDVAPAADLCAKGTPSRVNGSGPWTWACSGNNGGTAAACMANRKIDGVCGAATNEGTDAMPLRDLCIAGYASAVTGSGPWQWSCSGLHGGSAATCSANAKINGICGAASTKGHRVSPQEELCNAGIASQVAGDGPWQWQCKGDLGGASVNCEASVSQDGSCGLAHGNRYSKAPKEGLCAGGIPSRVTGVGPWNWNCTGKDGGTTVSCTAALGSSEDDAASVSCGEASEVLALDEPKEKLCRAGSASDVSGEGPWSWICSDNAGHSTTCSTLSPSDGVCGSAAGVKSYEAPSKNLCKDGTPGEVSAFQKKAWKWDCQGTMGAKSVECFAPMIGGVEPIVQTETVSSSQPHEPSCGEATKQGHSIKPDASLCVDGKPSAIKGNGPWTWSCSSGKNKVSCEAPKLIEGVCGVANGSIQRSAPISELCSTGVATEVTGFGPWSWSCVGVGGGASSSCSAASQAKTKVDGSCGAAASAVMTNAPSTNLCDSGMPSRVYGDGPWTWTCSGMNGGIASTCSTSKTVPKAPPPPGPTVNGVCGYANGAAVLRSPDEGLCSSGTATALSGNGPWNWGCIGANGGMTVSCTAPLMPPAPIVGDCGSSSGVPTLTAPRSGLCAAGIASAVSGKGPWTWSCSGTNGGGAVACVAPMAGQGSSSRQPLPSMVTPSYPSQATSGEAPTPKAAPVGLVTPQLSSASLQPLKPGTVPSLKTTKKDIESANKSAKGEKVKAKASVSDVDIPNSAPELPAGMEPLPAPLRDHNAPIEGIKSPVLDSDGKPIVGAKVVLEPDVSTISFTRGSDQLDKDGVEIAEKLVKILTSNASARITLVAYADAGSDMSPRDARRLSLNRALVIRDFMTSKGVPSSRVDVRPMGSNVPSGDMDRVDVKVN